MAIKFFNTPEKLWKLINLMLNGAGVTLSIFFLTLLFSVPLGMLAKFPDCPDTGSVTQIIGRICTVYDSVKSIVGRGRYNSFKDDFLAMITSVGTI